VLVRGCADQAFVIVLRGRSVGAWHAACFAAAQQAPAQARVVDRDAAAFSHDLGERRRGGEGIEQT